MSARPQDGGARKGRGRPDRPVRKRGKTTRAAAGGEQPGASNAKRRAKAQAKRRNRRRGKPTGPEGPGFWGDPAQLPDAETDVRMNEDPAAVPRSLGPPPLPGHEAIADHYFAAVYDRAVNTAGALAAAGGLIDPDALLDD